jgi:hypothetical protein
MHRSQHLILEHIYTNPSVRIEYEQDIPGRPDQTGMIPMESTRIRNHDCRNPATCRKWPLATHRHPSSAGLRMLPITH